MTQIGKEKRGRRDIAELKPCPFCRSSFITDAVKCDICGNGVPSEEIIAAEGYHFCEVCIDQAVEKAQKILEDQLTLEERAAIHYANEAWE